jgi:biopolymer transport protein ExbB
MYSSRLNLKLRLGRLWICAALTLSGLQFAAAVAQAQEPAPGGEAAGAPATTQIVTKKTTLEKLEEGGWVMYPILGFSILTIWLSTDLWIRTGKKRLAPDAHVNGAKDLFRMGDYVGAYQHCKNNPSAFSDSVRVALSFVGEGQQPTEDALIGELNKFNAAITTRINYLSVIGVCTPMVGLLGTTTGMVSAFEHLGTAGVGDPSGLSAAIGEVLIATASGLAIAIPAFMMFYVLRNRLQGALHYCQDILLSLFRKMPYEDLRDCHVGEEEFFAARPNWVADEEATATAVPV